MLLQKRNNSYYFRYTYPPEIRAIIGRRELCKSLRTPNKLIAQSKSAKYFVFVAVIKDIYSNMSELTSLQLKKLVQEASENLNADIDMTRASESTTLAIEAIQAEMYTLEEYWDSENGEFEVTPSDAYIRLVSQPDYEGEDIETTLSHWDEVFERCGIDRTKYSHTTQFRLLEELLLIYNPWLHNKFCTIKANIEKGGQRYPSISTPDYLSSPKIAVDKQITAKRPKKRNKIQKGLPVVSGVYKEFLSYKADLTPKMVASYDRYMEILIAIIGDKPIDKVDKKCLKKALLLIEKLPVKNRKPYNKMSWSEILNIEVSEADYIAPKTVEGHLKFWQSLFAYARLEADYIEMSPAKNIKYQVDSRENSYVRFSDFEIINILTLAKSSSQDWFYMLCLLAAYTGARKGELLALKTSDFKKDIDTGRDYFYIAKSKTKAGKRKVPIAQTIIDEVMSYVRNIADGELLFPEGEKKEKRFVDWIRGYLEQAGCELIDDDGRRKVFHSFRHTFITKALESNIETLVQSVVGHEHSNIGQTQVYAGEYSLSAVLSVVDNISYKKP